MAVVEKNGSYYAVVWIANEKKQKWISCGKSKKKAKAIHEEYQSRARRGELRTLKKATFKQFSELWLADYCRVTLKPVTISEYESYLNRYLVPAFGNLQLTAIHSDDIQRHVADLVREHRLATKSIRNQMVPLRRMFAVAKQWGYVDENPAEGIALPKLERKEMSFLSTEEMRRLIDHTPAEWKGLVALGCMCGLRKGEILGLTWSNVLFDSHEVWVRQSLWRGQLQTPKTPRSVGKVPMPSSLEGLLLERMTLSPASELDLVFCRTDGSPLRAEFVNNGILTPALKAAGLPKITFHAATRHSFVAAHIAAGTPIKVIQELARHTSIQTTMDRYGHLMPDSKTDAAARIEAAMWG